MYETKKQQQQKSLNNLVETDMPNPEESDRS